MTFLEEHIRVLFNDIVMMVCCLHVKKVKMSSWVTFFHFICKAQSAEWSLIHNGTLKTEGMNDYLEWRNLQVFIELELENSSVEGQCLKQWGGAGLLLTCLTTFSLDLLHG